MSVASISDAAGAQPSLDMTRLQRLADDVRAAQEARRRAGEELLAAQSRLRTTTEEVEVAEARFREACPLAFGLAPQVQTNSHPIDDWLHTRCDLSYRHATTSASDLYRDFIEWGLASGLPQCAPGRWTQTQFGRELTTRGYLGRKDRRGLAKRIGISLRTGPDHG